MIDANVLPDISQDYPYNLLIAAKGESEVVLPQVLTPDVLAGLQYILSLLDERERNILQQRYQEQMVRSVIGTSHGVSQERIRQIELKALRKMRLPSRWGYIQYGVAGYLKSEPPANITGATLWATKPVTKTAWRTPDTAMIPLFRRRFCGCL